MSPVLLEKNRSPRRGNSPPLSPSSEATSSLEQLNRMWIPPRPAGTIRLLAGAPWAGSKGADLDGGYRTVATIAIVCLVILGCAALIGGVVLVIALRRAPDGVEDEDGFHRIEKQRR